MNKLIRRRSSILETISRAQGKIVHVNQLQQRHQATNVNSRRQPERIDVEKRSLESVVFGIGNPLLDIIATVPESLMNKYDIRPASAILAEPRHLKLYEELTDHYPVKYVAGGQVQNILRVYQWMIQCQNSATFVGCIGQDRFGEILRREALEDGLNVEYMTHPHLPTGTCAALVYGKDRERSLVANLGAAHEYRFDHMSDDKVSTFIQKAEYYCIEGFFLTVCPESILNMGKYASEKDKCLLINLSATYIISAYSELLLQLLPYTDYVFGNADEARAFSRMMNYGTDDVRTIAERLSVYTKANKRRDRVVIITEGPHSITVAYQGTSMLVPVVPVPERLLVDTNGAGDAFEGGFLAALVKGHEIDSCVQAGIYSSSVIVQHSGCTFPPDPPLYEI